MRIAADGFIDVRDGRRVRTPGFDTREVEPVPAGDALAYVLSHAFPGHRRVVRGLSPSECRKVRLAMWASSVSERMSLVDRIWRAITEAAMPPKRADRPELLQVVTFEGWAYPIYLDGNSTRVIPHGGLSLAELDAKMVLDLTPERKTA